MTGFHQRFMGSRRACKIWSDRVSKYEISAIAPQHGAIMVGDHVKLFLKWLAELQCGIDLL